MWAYIHKVTGISGHPNEDTKSESLLQIADYTASSHHGNCWAEKPKPTNLQSCKSPEPTAVKETSIKSIQTLQYLKYVNP